MKKIILFILVVIITVFTASCGVNNVELSENISAPENLNIPIEGTYVVDDYKLSTISDMSKDEADGYIGKEAVFSKDLVAIVDDLCYEPTFKIKNVKTNEYLIYNYKTNPELLNISDEEIQVVTITCENQFFNDFIKISEDRVIVNINGVFFFLNKISDDVEEGEIKINTSSREIALMTTESMEKTNLNSGILLGLKSLDLEQEDNDLEKWNYRTVFIRSSQKSIVSIQEMENILLPRRTGFWKVEVQREEIDGKINDKIVAYPINKGANVTIEAKDEDLEGKLEKSIKETSKESDPSIKNILFLSNDYISIENIQYRKKGQRYLELYPVDNISKGQSIKISDIMGETGREALIEGFTIEIATKENSKGLQNYIPKEDSFGLFRRNGLWILKGRVNYIENGNYVYEDFNIPTIPTEEIIPYDELCIPWSEIKSKCPEALDAFTSPNEDIAVILTHNEILIYTIEEDTIGNEPIGKVQLRTGEKVIMSEWAIGRFPKLWEQQFIEEEK